MKPTSPQPTAGIPSSSTMPLSDSAEPVPHITASTAGTSVAVDNGPPRTGRPKGDGGIRIRLNKMFNTKTVPHEPSLRFEGDWQDVVAAQICDHWVASQRASNSVSLVALSRMKALDYERKHSDLIVLDQRLLPENSSEQDYYDAQMEAFLNAIGIRGEDLAELMESFKQAGTGGLHRQHVTAAATLNGLVGGTAQILSAQHPAASVVLYGVRLLFQGVVAERTLNSGERRLRNSGTEDVLPRGRADAAPSAKQAPTMFEASHDVIWELRGVEKNLRKMEAAMNALESARNDCAGSDTVENRNRVESARSNLEIAFAKICYQMEVKASYKASSESAKIELRGNERYLITSYTGASLTLGAGLFSILAPVLGAAAAPATGGVSIVAAALVMLLYAGYQLSSGPSKDGEAKARRAIVALTKSADILSGDKAASRGQRAAAYKAYMDAKKTARFKSGSARDAAKDAAKTELLAELDEISHQDNEIGAHMDLRQNWDAYLEYRKNVSRIVETAVTPEEISKQIRLLEEEFQGAHKNSFSTKAVAGAWKTPMSIRMITALRLLRGKAAESHRRLICLIHHPGLKARVSKGNHDRAIAAAREGLRQSLRDMFNLELALHHMRPLVDGNDPDPAAMERASIAIGAIEDADVRKAFCGDGGEQVAVTTKAKKLTAGEAERYTYPNAGSAVISTGMNLAVGATDLGLTAAKVSGTVHVGTTDPNPEGKPRIPTFYDHKLAAVSQAGPPLAAHLTAGDRAPFQNTHMPRVLDVTKRGNDELVAFTLCLGDADHLDKDNGWVGKELDSLVEQLARANSVPDRLILSLNSSSSDVEPVEIPVDLRATSGYHQIQYRNASVQKKLKVTKEKAGIVWRHAAMSVAGLPAQALAQINLKGTRAAFRRAAELDKDVRKNLHGPTNGADSMPSSPSPASGSSPAASPMSSGSPVDSPPFLGSMKALPDLPPGAVHRSTTPGTSSSSFRFPAPSEKELPPLPKTPGSDDQSMSSTAASSSALPSAAGRSGMRATWRSSMHSFLRKTPPLDPQPSDPKYLPILTINGIEQPSPNPALPEASSSSVAGGRANPAGRPGTPVNSIRRDPAPLSTGKKPLPPIQEEDET
ncbi:hypothetical protein EGT07_21660 [Herbaspirillum sp. HC18]|nr:hypothetical protein EGT07_21660 [Herbaspirillum sp. HC18]